MSLYPTTFLDATTAALGNNLMPSGALLVIPVDMTNVQMTQISMAQLALTQDFSLRTWVSLYPDGLAIERYFPILRTGGVPFVIYTAGQTPPANTYSIMVAPGNYFLNVLNLTNEHNVLRFSQIDLVASTTLIGGAAIGLTSTLVATRTPSTFVGCSSVGSAGAVLTSLSSSLRVVGTSGAGHVSAPVPRRTPPAVFGCSSAGTAGTTLTSISSAVVVGGRSGTGAVGTLSVMTFGLRLTPSQRLWQARRWK